MKNPLWAILLIIAISLMGIGWSIKQNDNNSLHNSKYKVTLVTSLSSPYSDYAPRFIDNTYQSLIFTSSQGSNGQWSNIFYTQIIDGKWEKPIALINSSGMGNDGIAAIDLKRNVVFITHCPVVKDQTAYCQINYSFLHGDMVGELLPLNLGINIDGAGTGHPYFSNELDVLFFVSNMAGGYGKEDIWFTKYDRATDTWGKPQNAGSEINTKENELYPSTSVDGTLYFSSDGHPGYGKWDIFKAQKHNDLSWGNVENMGKPINSEEDDFAIVFKGSSQSGFFSSNRKGGIGSDDIYEFSLVDSTLAENIDFATKSNTASDSSSLKALSEVLNKPACSITTDSLKIFGSKVYPNPSHGEFTLEFNSNENIHLTTRVFSNLGKLILNEPIEVTQGNFKRLYNINTVGTGIYYIQVLHNCVIIETQKVIVN